MKKKFISILILALAFTLAACNSDTAGDTDSDDSGDVAETEAEPLPDGQIIQYHNYQITLPYSFELDSETTESATYKEKTDDGRRSVLIGFIPDYPFSDDSKDEDKEALVSQLGGNVGEQISSFLVTVGEDSNFIVGANFESENSFTSIYITDADGDFYVFTFMGSTDEIYDFAADYVKTLYYMPVADEPADEPDENTNNDVYPEGTYKIGSDMPAGEYKLIPTSSLGGYYAIKSDSTGIDNIIENDNFENQTYVTVSEGQYLELSMCQAEPVA